MTEHRIDASSVTKPIQLLAAWLVGLLALNVSFLGAAAIINTPTWAPGLLVWSAVLNVPVFLACLFLLQTKFRPEMQEDSFYSKYLATRVSAETGREEVVAVQISQGAVAHPSGTTGISSNRWEKISVRVNDLLADFEEIAASLARAGINIDNLFGSTSPDREVPREVVVSLSTKAPVAEVQQLMRLIGDKVDYLSAIHTPTDDNAIYIGSYVYRHDQYNLVRWGGVAAKVLDPTFRSTDWIDVLGAPPPLSELPSAAP